MDNAASAKAIYFQNYCHLFGVSFLIWDHILTLGDERRFVWKRKKSATSVYLFFILRYGALGTNIPVLVFSFVTLKYRPCVEYDLIHQIFMLITQLVVSTVMILRIYSLYNRSARVLGALLGIGICFLSLTIWSVTQGQHGFPITVFQGCHLAIVQSASYHLAAPWTCLFVFDTIIFGLTINNACATRRGLGRYADMPIHRLLVRDGAMYFVATALANLVNIITFFIGGSLVPGSLATFATCMSVTMISRLMLNLHKRTEYGIFSELHLSEVENLNDLEFVAHRDGEGQSTSPSRNLHEFEDVPILPVNSPGPSGHAQ